jgi:hypothetical protein
MKVSGIFTLEEAREPREELGDVVQERPLFTRGMEVEKQIPMPQALPGGGVQETTVTQRILIHNEDGPVISIGPI